MGSTPIQLYDNQSIFGRSADFREKANAGEVTIIGSLYIPNLQNVGFHNFQLLNRDGLFDNGIVIDGAGSSASFIFDSVIIGREPLNDDPDPSNFRRGALVQNVETPVALTINQSSFYGLGNDSLTLVFFSFWLFFPVPESPGQLGYRLTRPE